MKDMRSLRLVVRTASGTLPLVVAASVSSGVACGQSESTDTSHGNASGGSGAGSGGASGTGGIATGGSAQGGAGIIIVPDGGSTGGTNGTGGGVACEPWCYTYTVPLPAAGMPVEPGQVCAVEVVPVESRVALVTLNSESSFQIVTGSVAIAPEVSVVGTPIVEVLDASHPALRALQISELVPNAEGGFSFQGTFPDPLPYVDAEDGYERLTVRVTLDVACEGGSRQVHSATDIHMCLLEGTGGWASSGEACCVCRIIAEMAPSPIVPEKHTDDLPLAQALRLRIVELARVSNTIVLLAENDGGDELEYEWVPSAGRIEKLADDVIAWTLEEGTPDPFVQAAVYGKNAAAVASFAFNNRVS
jgi:hypothetical protein